MPTFSILVPVYNVEKYVSQCLESILNQTYEDFEVLCVEDCSTDSSLKIIEQFALKDRRIKILRHETNQGLSAARNTGLEHAKGEFLLCVDSDDWIEPNSLEIILREFRSKKTNSIFFDAYRFDDTRQERCDEKILNNRAGFLEITPANIAKCSDYSWVKAYTLDSIKKHNLIWPVGLTFEDGEFSFKYFAHNPVTYIIENPLYNYRVRSDSIVTNAQRGKLKIEHIYQIIKNLREFCIKQGIYDRYKPAILELAKNRINTCKTIMNHREISLQMSKNLLEEFEFPQDFSELNNTSAPVFSIIVPIYNVENYIEKCIRSIQAQTFSNIEIICVDDCGNDNSIEIVKKMQKDDTRIKILKHRKNKGLGAARNTGLKAATGKYIMVVDSDDWLELNCVELVYNKFKETNYNSIWFKGNIYWEDEKKYTNLCLFPFYASYPEGNLTLTPKNITKFPLYSWCKAYKKDFLIQNKIKWPEGILFEDIEFHIKAFINSPEVYIIDKPLYIYRRHSDSIISACTENATKAKEIYSASRGVYKYLKKNNLLETYKEAYLQHVMDSINMFRSYSNTQKELCYYIKEFLKDIDFPNGFTTK